MSQKQQQKVVDNQQMDEEQMALLKDDISYWNLKSSDLCLDLETLKNETELDSENNNEEYDKICKELASVDSSLNRLRQQNSQLTSQMAEKADDVQNQKVQIRQTQQEIEKIGCQLSEMKEDNKRRAEAPDLTVQEYIQQLADRGDVEKLQQLCQATYYQISLLFSQQNMMQMHLANQNQMANAEGSTENGHVQYAPQMNGGVNMMGAPGAFPMGGMAMGQPGQQQMPMMNPFAMGGFPGMPMQNGQQPPQQQQTQQQQQQPPQNSNANSNQQQAPQNSNRQQQKPGRGRGNRRNNNQQQQQN